jgi:hypothetical protein
VAAPDVPGGRELRTWDGPVRLTNSRGEAFLQLVLTPVGQWSVYREDTADGSLTLRLHCEEADPGAVVQLAPPT